MKTIIKEPSEPLPMPDAESFAAQAFASRHHGGGEPRAAMAKHVVSRHGQRKCAGDTPSLSRRGLHWLGAWLALLLLAGCATPVGTTRTSSRVVFREISGSALDGRLSAATLNVIHRYDLVAQFERDPEAALALLHARACADDRRDVLYALAEANYQRGAQLHDSVKPGQSRRAPDFFLSSALYAWFYLLGDGDEPPPTPFDGRFRVACHLYNSALARAFVDGRPDNSVVRPVRGTRPLAPGVIRISLDDPASQATLAAVEELLPADEFLVRGLSVRNRQSGLGAPLIAVAPSQDGQLLSRRRFPVTLFLRVQGGVRAWSRGELAASIELYSAHATNRVQVGTRSIPLESDTTAPLAHRLNNSQLWELGSSQFFSGTERVKSDIYLTEPYQPGRIPVIFVHGTFSSPVKWAEMANTLDADPRLRERYQFWCFIYNSGNPVTYSAANLRSAIERRIAELDPRGTDPALKEMVIIGHSQGGLLTKLTAVDTGEKLWRAASDQDFDSLPMTADEREALRRCFFFKPLPSVKRVIFIATPHRGSYRSSRFVQRFLRRFMTLPGDVVRGAGTLLRVLNPSDIPKELGDAAPSSLYGMSVSNKLILTLAGIPVAPGVRSHSIIAVRGEGPAKQGGDGIVKYSSAHLEHTDSELIVRGGHSCQDKAPTIEEVRRILHEHLDSNQPLEPGRRPQ